MFRYTIFNPEEKLSELGGSIPPVETRNVSKRKEREEEEKLRIEAEKKEESLKK